MTPAVVVTVPRRRWKWRFLLLLTRQVWRHRRGVTAMAATTVTAALAWAAAGWPATALTAVVAARLTYPRLVRRRFHREYTTPVLQALAPALGLQPAQVRLHIDPGLGDLVGRLNKPLSPVEQHVRVFYGRRAEPVLRWVPDQIQRGRWRVRQWAAPVTTRVTEALRRPGEQAGPRIELQAPVPFMTSEQRQLVSAVIGAKIPVADLVESWHQVGPVVKARWIVRARPPGAVGAEQLRAHLGRLPEWEFYIGQGAAGTAVVLSLKDDSPHIAVSAGSGAGKSVFAMAVAVQVLNRGGRVTLLDRKGSHRWALGQPGVDYCTRPPQMHDALVKLAAVADQRNELALYEDDDWDPGPRHLVIAEELNATIAQLANHWAEVREKGAPKKSPAISALADLSFMGRSAKINLLAVAQMLTARAIGGPEARENFGIRCLARYTANNWKMLVPEAAMPRASRTQGRWQIVTGGKATETQVVYLSTAEARALATPAGLKTAPASDVHVDVDILTLQDAIDAGVLPWKLGAAQKRLQRNVGVVPEPRGKRGPSVLYGRDDLIRWAGGER